jgi:hypothetical protein
MLVKSFWRFWGGVVTNVVPVLKDRVGMTFDAIALLAVITVLFNRPLGNAIMNLDGFSAWWALAPIAVLALIAVTRSVHHEFLLIAKKHEALKEEQKAATAQVAALRNELEDQRPDIEHYRAIMERLKRQEEAYRPVAHARSLENKTKVLIDEVRGLIGLESLHPPRYPWWARAAREAPPKRLPEAEVLSRYDLEYHPRLLALKAEYEALDLVSADLSRQSSEQPRTMSTIQNITDGFRELIIRLEPIAWPKEDPIDA